MCLQFWPTFINIKFHLFNRQSVQRWQYFVSSDVSGFVCHDRSWPTDILHLTICSGFVNKLDHSLTKRCHLVSRVYTLSWGLESSPCSGLQKVLPHFKVTSRKYDKLCLFTVYVVKIVYVLGHVSSWCVQLPEMIFFCSCNASGCALNVYYALLFADRDSVRLKASTYAALHRGRPPERPLNSKQPPHLGGSHVALCSSLC